MNKITDERKAAITERYIESRAKLVTQLFVTLATVHGVGMTSVLSIIGKNENSHLLLPYLVAILFILAFGLQIDYS